MILRHRAPILHRAALLHRAVGPASRPGTSRIALFECGMCTDTSARRKNAYILLGLQPGAALSDVKKAYYRMAKSTHPDVIAREAREAATKAAADMGPKVVSFGSSSTGFLDEDHAAMAAKPTVVPFLEVQAAYNILMDDGGDDVATRSRTARAGSRPSRERTLGEVLCDRLRDEPEAYEELWEEICRDKMRVTEGMLDTIFKALRDSAKQGAMADAARHGQRIIHDGTAHGLLTIDTRCSAFIIMLTWCQAEEDELGDVALQGIDMISDEERAHSPAVMAAIGSVFCSGTRSPY